MLHFENLELAPAAEESWQTLSSDLTVKLGRFSLGPSPQSMWHLPQGVDSSVPRGRHLRAGIFSLLWFELNSSQEARVIQGESDSGRE